MDVKDNKMKILLIDPRSNNPKVGDFDIGNYELMEPLGLCYIGAVLKKEHEVKIIQQINEKNEKIIDIANKFKPDLVGFTVLTSTYTNALELAKGIKEKTKAVIIFGGVHPTTQPNIVKDKTIDLVVRGEGEITFRELVNRLENGKNFKDVNGLAYYENKVILTPQRHRIKDLDSLPFPLRNGFPREKYKSFALNYPAPSKQKLAAVITSRGCPHNCEFCINDVMWGRETKFRSVRNIVDELEYLIKDFGINHVYFEDETLGVERKRLDNLCNEIINKELNFSWSALMRVDGVDKDILALMKKAGCVQIPYGVESANPEILKQMNKGIALEQIVHAFELTYNAGIIPSALFIIGYPEETYENLESLKSFVLKLKALRYRFSNAYPFLGTMLRRRIDEKNLWIPKAGKNLELATTEEQVIKCGVNADYLNRFNRMMIKEIYYSDSYKKKAEEFVKKNPMFESSFKEFYAILNLI